jgi:hypothetical protein
MANVAIVALHFIGHVRSDAILVDLSTMFTLPVDHTTKKHAIQVRVERGIN